MIIQNEVDKLLPYLRAFAFDEQTLYVRFTVMFPAHWDISYLSRKSLLLSVLGNNGSSVLVMLGINTEGDLSEYPILEDKPIDYFFEEIGHVISFNLEKERKDVLLREKVKELEKLFNNVSLSEAENLKIIKGNDYEPIPVIIDSNLPASEIKNIISPEIKVPEIDPSFPHIEREPDEVISDNIPENFEDLEIPAIVKDMLESTKDDNAS